MKELKSRLRERVIDMTRYSISCPKCKAGGTAGIGENLLGEKVLTLRCKKCGSYSVSRDGIHWSIVIQNNTKKEVIVK